MPASELVAEGRGAVLLKRAKWLKSLAEAGTEGYDKHTKRRLMITNVACYLIVLSTVNYALIYAFWDFHLYKLVIAANVFLALAALLVPLCHRCNELFGALVIVVAEFAMLFYLVYLLGRDSGIQINYLVAAAVVFLIFDLKRFWLIVTIVVSGLVLSLAAWFLFPPQKAAIAADPLLLANVYTMSLVTTVGIVAASVYYALNLAERAQAETDALLRNILPESVADRLIAVPGTVIADSVEDASVLFADLVGFTPLSRSLGATKTVAMLNEIYTAFDDLTDRHGVEKIKTIGDAYMVVGGIPEPAHDHVERIARMALDMRRIVQEMSARIGGDFDLRIGIDCGPVMAGVIGKRKFAYDTWGDTVNMAARLESHGLPGRVHVSQGVAEVLGPAFALSRRGRVQIKGVGERVTWYLDGTPAM